MPTIAAFPDAIRAYVRVETNWADTPAVDCVTIYRVDAVTGERTPLRPYICFDGWCLDVSCGHAIFWDTEVPLDREVFYTAESPDAPCIPTAPLLYDLFTRTVVAGWGSATSGQAYSLLNGVAADYNVDGSRGTISVTATLSDRGQRVDVGERNVDAVITLANPGAPVTNGVQMGVAVRLTDASNYYSARASFSPAGQVTAWLAKMVAGVETTILTGSTALSTGGPDVQLRVQVLGSTLRMRLWYAGSTEPATWDLSVTDTSLTTGTQVAPFATRQVTSTSPTVFAFDNFYVTGPCDECEPVTVSTEPLTIGSDGKFRLKDPVRPCRDLVVPLCFDQVASPECLPGSGVFFASMASEAYATNSISVNPTNAEFPIAMSRTRRGVSSTLTLVTRTFADRDALKLITKPGSPLLFQGPPQYGIPDRYMDVGDTDFDRGKSDHKYQARVAALPHTEVARPAGPTLGVCGSRVMDLCDVYATWQDMVDAGLNWDDLIRGRAGQPDPTTGFRTWADVRTEFTDWADVDDGTRTWFDLLVGD